MYLNNSIINLIQNRIGIVPDSYSNLPMLKVIDVSHNNLKDFPPEFLFMKNLEVSWYKCIIIITLFASSN